MLPVGGYRFGSARAGFTFGRPRRLSGTLTAEYGEFFDGHRTALTVSRSLVELSPSLTLEPNVSVNWIDLDEGAFTTTLVAARATYTLTPFAFFGALLQYNSSNDSLGQTCDCAGSINRAASCSSSTTSSATR